MTTTTLTFGQALEALKAGHRIARAGWNGKGMFVYLNKGVIDANQPCNNHIDGVPVDLFENGPDGIGARLPNINMRSATGSIVTGWLASQTDMLAEDWEVVDA